MQFPTKSKHSKPQGGKAKRNPQEGISANVQSQVISGLAPNGSNSKVPAGQFQQRSELVPEGINSEVSAGEFCVNRVWNSNLGFKFWARGRVLKDLKRQISLCTSHFFLSQRSGKKKDIATIWKKWIHDQDKQVCGIVYDYKQIYSNYEGFYALCPSNLKNTWMIVQEMRPLPL